MSDNAVRVLLIEDNPGDTRLIDEMLKDIQGFSFVLEWVDRLSLGLSCLKSSRIDVVVLDLTLPDSSGYETFQQLHKRFPQTPVVLLTGLEDEGLGLRAVRDGAQDYLAKGNLDGNLLARAVRYAMERKRSADALRKSEQLFEKIFSNLIDAVFIINSHSLVIANCNRAASEIFGYSREEMIGKQAVFLLDKQPGSSIVSIDTLVSSKIQRGAIQEMALRRKNGDYFFAEFSYVALQDDPAQMSHWVVLVRDISLRKEAQETLKESEERYILAVRGANDGLWDWNIRKEQVYYSPRWKAILGYVEDEITASIEEWFSRIHPDDRESVSLALSSHLNGHTAHFESEHRMMHRDGKYRWMLVRGLAVRQPNGIAYRMAGSQTDITPRKNAEEQLVHDAFHDVLTGLPNRSLFLDRLGRTIEHSRRYEDYLFAVLFLDLDRFKIINDSLGHVVGDQLLIEISKVLKTCMRSGDTVARFGGDEFVILLEDIHDIHDALLVAGRIQEVLENPFLVGESQVFTSTSIGIVLSTVGYISREDVLRDADIAMYQAKMLGKAQYVIFDTSMRSQAIARLQLENDLRHALVRGEFELHYQPIVLLKDNSISGFEALIRWQHPEKGCIEPIEFIPLAEETGLILEIGYWVLHQACSQMRKWQEQFSGLNGMQVSINISQRQFNQPDLLQQIQNVLSETGLIPLA